MIVDAVAAVFSFGSDEFVRLRERFWLEIFQSAAAEGRSLIFTFSPEPTVDPNFPARASAIVDAVGGRVFFVRLMLNADEQERRITNLDRAAFGKLRSVELLLQLRSEFTVCMHAMPEAAITIDTNIVSPDEAATKIIAALSA